MATATAAVKLTNQTETITRSVKLLGTRPLMFDRYAGDNDTKLEVWQKLYFQTGSEVIGLPSANLMSFLSAHNTNSSPKRLRDKRKFKDIANACLSFVEINPLFIPLLRDGKPIEFGKFAVEPGGEERDPLSGMYVDRSVARLDKGIPNPKVRPVLPLAWALQFTLTIYPNREIKEQEILNLYEEGGRAIGLGTWRGMYGKFIVSEWE